MDELKPCPFCGGKVDWDKFSEDDGWVPCCEDENCYAFVPQGTEGIGKAELAKMWNTRPADERKPEECESDPRIARLVRACREIDNHCFYAFDEKGEDRYPAMEIEQLEAMREPLREFDGEFEDEEENDVETKGI